MRTDVSWWSDLRAGGRPSAPGRVVVVVLLIGGTSWAIAGWVAPVLVPGYLLAMALILWPVGPTASWRLGGPVGSAPPPAVDLGELPPATGPFAGAVALPDGAEAEAETPLAPDPTTVAPARSRRPRSRSRKAGGSKSTGDSTRLPLPATWVEVSPGKFVRTDAPATVTPTEPESPTPESTTANHHHQHHHDDHKDAAVATPRLDPPQPLADEATSAVGPDQPANDQAPGGWIIAEATHPTTPDAQTSTSDQEPTANTTPASALIVAGGARPPRLRINRVNRSRSTTRDAALRPSGRSEASPPGRLGRAPQGQRRVDRRPGPRSGRGDRPWSGSTRRHPGRL